MKIHIIIICLALGIVFAVFARKQKLYSIENMPIVDAHTHFGSRDLNGTDNLERYRECVDKMDEWGGAVTIDLNGTRNKEQVLGDIKTDLHNRVRITIRATEHLSEDYSDYLWWTMDDLEHFGKVGFVGVKLHLGKYKELLSEVDAWKTPNIDDNVKTMGELGLPFVGMHVGEPPEGGWYVEGKYMVHQLAAEKYIRAHPKTIFIMAHMFWLCCNDSSLDTLAMFFDRCPNLYADMAATFMYFTPPEPSYKKLRNFIIRYKDRLLFGTDGSGRQPASQWIRLRHYLETDDEDAQSFSIDQKMKGLGLPLHVLNSIYYWNAAHLIPGIKESLEGLGYEIGDEPPQDPRVESPPKGENGLKQ